MSLTYDDRDRPLPAYLTQRELATRWNLSTRTLERWRAEPYGPAWHVLGGSVRYRTADVLAYEAARKKNG